MRMNLVLNPTMKMRWIDDNWTPTEAVDAREWMLEAVSHDYEPLCKAVVSCAHYQMCEYRTHERHKLQSSARSKTTRTTSLPATTAAARAHDSQRRGLAGLRDMAARCVQRSSSMPAPSKGAPSLEADSQSQHHDSTPDVSSGERHATSDSSESPHYTEEAECARDRRLVEQELELYLREESDSLEDIADSSDLYRYWAVSCSTHLDESQLMLFVQARKYRFPYMYRVALDVLPAQASAVSCERMFSSSKETDTLRRNRLSPQVMEALQILKYYYKQEQLNFTSRLVAREEDYTIEGPLTEAAVEELWETGQYEVLEDLIRNSQSRAEDEDIA